MVSQPPLFPDSCRSRTPSGPSPGRVCRSFPVVLSNSARPSPPFNFTSSAPISFSPCKQNPPNIWRICRNASFIIIYNFPLPLEVSSGSPPLQLLDPLLLSLLCCWSLCLLPDWSFTAANYPACDLTHYSARFDHP